MKTKHRSSDFIISKEAPFEILKNDLETEKNNSRQQPSILI
jgi:hypothetical protein